MNQENILERLDAALKSITTADLGASVLSPEKAAQFVRELSEATPILQAARRLDMKSHTRDIDRVGFSTRIMGAATEGAEATNESKANFNTNKLESQEVVAIVGITDSSLEDNIEKGDFEDTLLAMMGKQSGVDIEELFINGDKASADSYLKVTDGWIKKANNVVDGGATTPAFDVTNVEAMFEAQLAAMPKKFLRNRSELRFYVPWDVENDYRNVLKGRNSALGDAAQTGAGQLAYKGIPVEFAANVPEGHALLAPVNNLVYGVYRDIRIEPDRQAKARKTDFVLTMRVDCHYEDENAAVVAKGYTGA